MNHAQAFDKLRATGTESDDAYITILTAKGFAPAPATTRNGSTVCCTTSAPDSFTVETLEELIAR